VKTRPLNRFPRSRLAYVLDFIDADTDQRERFNDFSRKLLQTGLTECGGGGRIVQSGLAADPTASLTAERRAPLCGIHKGTL